jgi:hypothetical protein
LNRLIYVSKNIDDLNLVTNATKLMLSKNKIQKDRFDGLGTLIMRLVYVINETDKGIELIKDKVTQINVN